MNYRSLLVSSALIFGFVTTAQALKLKQVYSSDDNQKSQLLKLDLDTERTEAKTQWLKRVAEHYYQVDVASSINGQTRIGSTAGDYQFIVNDGIETTIANYTVRENRWHCNDAEVFDLQLEVWATVVVVANDGSRAESELRVSDIVEKSDCDVRKVAASAEALLRFKRNPQAFIMATTPADIIHFTPYNKSYTEIPAE
jgi:hypothetical protein